MTMPDEMFNSLRNARHFMLALMDPKQTPKVPREVRNQARDRLRHFPSEYEIGELEKMHSSSDKDPNILLQDCMKRLDSVRGEIIMAEHKVTAVGNRIVETIRNNAGASNAQQQD